MATYYVITDTKFQKNSETHFIRAGSAIDSASEEYTILAALSTAVLWPATDAAIVTAAAAAKVQILNGAPSEVTERAMLVAAAKSGYTAKYP